MMALTQIIILLYTVFCWFLHHLLLIYERHLYFEIQVFLIPNLGSADVCKVNFRTSYYCRMLSCSLDTTSKDRMVHCHNKYNFNTSIKEIYSFEICRRLILLLGDNNFNINVVLTHLTLPYLDLLYLQGGCK